MKVVAFLTLVLALAASAWGQSEIATGDTVATGKIVLLDPGISLGRPTFLIPPSILEEPVFIVPPFFSSMDYAMAPPFFAGWKEKKLDLMAPLRLQMQREEKLQTLQTVLGAMQFGGAVYIAYQHVKKYGFLK